MRWRSPVVLAMVLAGTSGCTSCLAKSAPGKVAMGVARLTVRHAGIITSLIDADTRCGFSSDVVLRAAIAQGQPGETGALLYEVKGCRLSFPESTVVSTDCEGLTTSVQGTVTVSATKRIRGTITGSATTPVIPQGADAVTLEIDADFEGLRVTKSNSSASLTADSGRLHYVIEPRLALSKSLGVCAISTLDLSLSEIEWRDGVVTIADGSRVFQADVATSSYVAQVGKYLDHENDFSGTLTVFGSEQKLPVDSEPTAIDSEYTPEAYFKSIACTPDLATPVSYACPSMKEQVVHGAARLTISHLGAVTSLIDADARCGFSSASVLAAAQLTGTTGALGSARLTLAAPCTIAFPVATPIGTNCAGVVQTAEGSITVTGVKTLTGVLTGDVLQPVVPNGRDPATLALSVRFDGFKLYDSGSTRSLNVVSGTLTGTLKPRVAIDARTDICSISTSIVEFKDVEWADALLEVTSDGLTFRAPISQATLQAQSGTKDDRTNYLAGTVISEGVPVTIPPAGASPVLDPSYADAAFLATFSCKPGLKLAPDEASCSVDHALATNTARLLLLAAGTTASQIQGDTNCGFSAFSVKTNPTRVTGEDGQMGELQWDVQSCRIGQSTGTASAGVDCLGITTYLSGTANVSAQRIVRGERDTELVLFDSIIPRTRDALSITLMNTPLTEYSVFKTLPGEPLPFAKLTLHSGTLSGRVTPSLGERTSKPGVFDIGTPVATFTDVQLMNANATLQIGDKRFTLVIPNAQVSGQNGTFRGVSNTVFGNISLGSGRTVTLSAGTILDPTFTQESFDMSYACTADLRGVIPPN